MNTAMNITPTLHQLGWKPFFQQQLTLEELTEFMIGRVIEQHRSSIVVMAEQGQVTLTLSPNSERVCSLNNDFKLDRIEGDLGKRYERGH